MDGDVRRALVPDHFVSQEPDRVDLAALAAWLGLPEDVASDLPPTASGERWQGEENGEWFIAEADDEGDPLWLGPFPGWKSQVTIPIPSPSPIPEGADAAWIGEAALAFQHPEVGDTDAWPDDVDGWLAAIDAIAEGWRGTLRASDVRTIYGGLDDEILELTEDGAVGEEATDAVDDGRRYIPPAEDDSSWDPATGSLDPALEEAVRIRGLPGALPPPEDPQTAPPSRGAADIGEHEDLPVIPMDNPR